MLDKAGVHELEGEVVVCDGMIRLSDEVTDCCGSYEDLKVVVLQIMDSICKLLLLG